MKVKICGLKCIEDVLISSQLGADFLGFIFYEKSPRHNNVSNVLEILNSYKGKAKPVAVFVNEKYENIIQVCNLTNIKIVQLSGDEDQQFIAKLKSTGLEVFKTIAIRSEESFEVMHMMEPSRFLLDTWHPVLKGGVGKEFNWDFLADRKSVASQSIIAGGINPGNISSLLQKVIPWGIDVSSGVESSPGKKNPQKLEQLFSFISSFFSKDD